jgi:hypothetical protein
MVRVPVIAHTLLNHARAQTLSPRPVGFRHAAISAQEGMAPCRCCCLQHTIPRTFTLPCTEREWSDHPSVFPPPLLLPSCLTPWRVVASGWKRAAQTGAKANDADDSAACRPIRRMDSRRWASRAAPSRHSSATSRRSCRYAFSAHHRRNPVPPIHIPPTFIPAKGAPARTCSAKCGRGPACFRGATDDEGG